MIRIVAQLSPQRLTGLERSYKTASADIRSRLDEYEFDPLIDGDKLDYLVMDLDRALAGLDKIFKLLKEPDDLQLTSAELKSQKILKDGYGVNEGSKNRVEHLIGALYRNIHSVRGAAHSLLKEPISPADIKKRTTPKVLKDIYKLTDFVCKKFIPLMNKEQVKFHKNHYCKQADPDKTWQDFSLY